MRSLFPKISCNKSELLDVGDGHQLYVEEVGNPNGIPVVFLHGGPGTGANENCRRLFDPDKFRVIIFDQRGCGRSQPFASIENNTSAELIADIEKIRQHFHIERWAVFGGSWGATLALLYAIAYPDRVSAMVLRGVYLAREKDANWLFNAGGISEMFPDYFEQFISPISQYNPKVSIADQYYPLIHSSNDFVRQNALIRWSEWENHFASLDMMSNVPPVDKHSVVARSAISNHFVRHHCFIEDNFILNNIDSIKHIPTTIVHGRLDLICRAEQAVILAKHLSNAQLQLVPCAGHSMFDQFMVDALIRANDDMAKFFGEVKA